MNKIQELEYEILCEIKQICDRHKIPFILIFGSMLGAVRHKGFIPWDDDIDIGMTREDYEKFLTVAKELPSNMIIQNHDNEPEYLSALPKVRNTEFPMTEYAYRHANISTGVWVDIFVYDRIPEDLTARKKAVTEIWKLFHRVHRNTLIHATPSERGGKAFVKRIIEKINIARKTRTSEKYQLCFKKLQDTIIANADPSSNILTTFSLYKPVSIYLESLLTSKDFIDTIEVPFEDDLFPIPQRYHEILKAEYGDYMTPPAEAEQTSMHFIIES